MRICFVASRFPFPIMKGDTLRAYHQIRELSREHSIHLITASETAPSAAAMTEMRKYCENIDVVKIGKARSYATVAAFGLGSRLPLQVLYFLAPQLRAAVLRAVQGRRFDIIHAMTIRVAPAVLDVPGVPVVVDFMDSFAANIATRREHVSPVMRRIYDFELSRVTAYEREVARRTAGGFVIAELDRDTIGDPALGIIPNGVDTESLGYYGGERDPATLVFTGNMGYQPNVDAVTWFAAESWPALRKRYPELRLLIVGARPAPVVSALARLEGIEVTGRVESMEPYLHRATVAICPIRCGSGMQNKILEAMAAGVPVVTTPFANRSIDAAGGREILLGADGPSFGAAVAELLDDPHLARVQAQAARRFVESRYAWAQRASEQIRTYELAIERNSRTAARAVAVTRS